MQAAAQIHINQQVLGHNRRRGTAEPPITTKRRRSNTYAQAVQILSPGGVLAEVRHQDGRCWLATTACCRLLDANGALLHTLERGPALQVRVLGPAIRANLRAPRAAAPVLRACGRGEDLAAYQAELLDEDGNVQARVLYRPDRPLSCGARVWIETYAELRFEGAGWPSCLPVRRPRAA